MKIKNAKKRFEKPALEIVEFTNDDIITESFGNPNPGAGDIFPTNWWGDGDEDLL